jgi:hypothetical protein
MVCALAPQVLRREGSETIEDVMLREFFGNDNSKRVQAQLVAKYLLHELYCIQVGCAVPVM